MGQRSAPLRLASWAVCVLLVMFDVPTLMAQRMCSECGSSDDEKSERT